MILSKTQPDLSPISWNFLPSICPHRIQNQTSKIDIPTYHDLHKPRESKLSGFCRCTQIPIKIRSEKNKDYATNPPKITNGTNIWKHLSSNTIRNYRSTRHEAFNVEQNLYSQSECKWWMLIQILDTQFSMFKGYLL